MSNKKMITLQKLLVLTVALTIICTWGYGFSYIVYVATSVYLAVFAYWSFAKKTCSRCNNIESCIWMYLVVNLICSLFKGDLKSMVLTDISLLMPFTIAYLNIDTSNIGKESKKASYIAMIFCVLLLLVAPTQNSNTTAIVLYSCMSISYIWVYSRSSMKGGNGAFAYSVIMIFLIFTSGSRNAALVTVLCFVMVMFFKNAVKNEQIFRLIYITAMLLTIFAIPFMTFVFNNLRLMELLIKFTSLISDKQWGMSSHLYILITVRNYFEELPLISQLLGEGVKTQNCHNLFYQCLFFYGYIGTFGIYAFYVYIFETGYKLYKRYRDILSIACCSMLIGFFLMQCGETFMLGSETPMMIGALPAGIIMHQNRSYKIKTNARGR